MKDKLFLMKPGFELDQTCPRYCGDSVAVEGLLSFYPALRGLVDVNYVAFPRPRTVIVDLIGADRQSVPVIVLADDRVVKDPSLFPSSARGSRFIDDEMQIRKYLSSQYGFAQSS